MKFGVDSVKYMARLARMRLSEKEIQGLSTQLGNILSYVEKLNQIDTAKVQPTSHVLPLKNVYREDKSRPSLKAKDVLKGAPSKEEDFFKVPKIIG